jgi:hypothetical protein
MEEFVLTSDRSVVGEMGDVSTTNLEHNVSNGSRTGPQCQFQVPLQRIAQRVEAFDRDCPDSIRKNYPLRD